MSLVVIALALFAPSSASALGAAAPHADHARTTPTAATAPEADTKQIAPVATSQRPSYRTVRGWVDSYRKAHPGKSGDINAVGPADSTGRRLLKVCGSDRRPVIPRLAWEYGGHDHAWIHTGRSALVYCVYTPVKPSTSHWRLRRGDVTADVYVLFPAQNPCADKRGAEIVLGCLGDRSNSEILVDTASLHDGHDVGLELSEAATTLKLILPHTDKKVTLIKNS
jgi:hypothetical protein